MDITGVYDLCSCLQQVLLIQLLLLQIQQHVERFVLKWIHEDYCMYQNGGGHVPIVATLLSDIHFCGDKG